MKDLIDRLELVEAKGAAKKGIPVQSIAAAFTAFLTGNMNSAIGTLRSMDFDPQVPAEDASDTYQKVLKSMVNIVKKFDAGKFQMKPSTKKIEWGFDLTDFGSAAQWKQIVDEFGLKYARVEKKSPVDEKYSYFHYEWKGPGILIVTGNNPITGEYSNPALRQPEKGYASYMGLEGEEWRVKQAVKMIKKLSTYIKDESKNDREYI